MDCGFGDPLHVGCWCSLSMPPSVYVPCFSTWCFSNYLRGGRLWRCCDPHVECGFGDPLHVGCWCSPSVPPSASLHWLPLGVLAINCRLAGSGPDVILILACWCSLQGYVDYCLDLLGLSLEICMFIAIDESLYLSLFFAPPLILCFYLLLCICYLFLPQIFTFPYFQS